MAVLRLQPAIQEVSTMILVIVFDAWKNDDTIVTPFPLD